MNKYEVFFTRGVKEEKILVDTETSFDEFLAEMGEAAREGSYVSFSSFAIPARSVTLIREVE